MIADIIPETVSAKTFVLSFMESEAPAYLPGQFITLVFKTRHGEKRRSYSISSSPDVNEPFSITVKRIDNGEFSRPLIAHAKTVDRLTVAGISGRFLLPHNIDAVKMYCFLAAGSGITPCFSMIKTILIKSQSNILLIYSNSSAGDVIFHERLHDLQERFPGRLMIRFLYSNVFNVYESRLSKWLLLQLMDQYLGALQQETLYYMCGPFEYMRMIQITLSERVERNRIFKENFNALPPVVHIRPPDTDAHQVLIRIDGRQHDVRVRYPSSILAAAKSNCIKLPYSCEAGRCGSCAATVLKGKVWMAYNEVLTDEEIAAGRVLTCQGFPVEGDAEISF